MLGNPFNKLLCLGQISFLSVLGISMDLELYFDKFQGVKFTKIVLGATYLNHQICFRALSNINVLHTFFIFLTDT